MEDFRMKDKLKKLLRAIAFLLVFMMLFSAVSDIFQPIWLAWNNHSTIEGFYEEPRDTIETVFIGSSVAISGFIPAHLYENYGMCAYNLSTVQQSPLASYYWLKEVYRLHSKSLKNVVMNASQFFGVTVDNKPYEESMFRQALDNMRLSPVKIRAILDYTDGNWSEALNYLIPFISYHTRWTELVAIDFKKSLYPTVNGTRGYQVSNSTLASLSGFESSPITSRLLDPEADPDEPVPDAVLYLGKMKEFCDQHGLNLLLVRPPAEYWTSNQSNAVQAVADQMNLTYLDFNFNPLYDELDYFLWLDSQDSVHPNYSGASKLTDWIGRYIVENYGCTDVRGNPRFAHMEEQLMLHQVSVGLPTALNASTNVADYLSTAAAHECYVFIMVRDEAAASLTDDQRETFLSLGLTQLASLGQQDSYLAIIKNGRVIVEQTLRSSETNTPPGPVTRTGTLANGLGYSLKSGGFNHGCIASCQINGLEFALNQRGINIVVYNSLLDMPIDSACFDTYLSSTREVYTPDLISEIKAADPDSYAPDSLEARLQEYLAREQLSRSLEESGAAYETDELFRFLTDYRSDPDNLIILSVRDDASGSLDDVSRQLLSACGLPVLSGIGHRESYIAVIHGTSDPMEISRPAGETAVFGTDLFSASSAGLDAGNLSSICIGGVEYSPNQRGINAVVYNRVSGSIVGCSAFDTAMIAQVIPEELAEQQSIKWQLEPLIEEQNAAYGPGDLFSYLNDYWADPDNTILISAKDDAASSLFWEAREYLAACGLNELAAISHREGYAACIEGGAVLGEIRSDSQSPAVFTHGNISIRSAGYDAGNISSIVIGGVEYSPALRGLNIVVYSKSADSVISWINFDTCLIPITLPDASAIQSANNQ